MTHSIHGASQSTKHKTIKKDRSNGAQPLINRTLAVITDELHAALKNETDDILAIGELLSEAKAQLRHGEWLPWLKEQCSLSKRSAQRYMKAYEFFKNVTVTHFKLSPKALYLLSEDDYWDDDYARDAATDAVLKEAAVQRVGSDRAKEIIEETRAKERAREEALARAMSDDMEAAKRQAHENGKRWEDIEPDWKRRWIDDNWGDERQAEFDAEWEEICARKQQTADEAEAAAPTVEQRSEAGAASVAPESEEDPIQRITRTSQKARPSRSGIGHNDERRPRGAAAADQDTRRMAGIDQLKHCIEEVVRIISLPVYDDRDRLMIRHEHEPYLDGFIDQRGKLRFEQSRSEADATPQSLNGVQGNAAVCPE